jgi:hypothetical protein
VNLWNEEMDHLLLWMREEKYPYHFIAEIISREFKINITKNACVGRYHRRTK